MRVRYTILLILFCFWLPVAGWSAPIEFIDDIGNNVKLEKPPLRVVSLVPSATEIIFAIGAGENIVGITYLSRHLPGAEHKTIVGGFLAPSIDRIASLAPDLVIASSLQLKVLKRSRDKIPLMVLRTQKMTDAFRHIELMGSLFRQKKSAAQLIEKNRRQLELVARKIARIPQEKRKRVMRFMGSGKMMTPGKDSFQNEMIRAAGGIAPDFGKTGNVVTVTREEFFQFNPQLIYGCGNYRKSAERLFSQKEWTSVPAIREKNFFSFPCDLTCRSGARLGEFVSWLASVTYAEEFFLPNNEILPEKIVRTRPIPIALDFVKNARIATSVLHDFENKSLIIDFATPRTIVSTLEGQRSGISTVGNHYSPPPCWSLNHSAGLAELRRGIYKVLGKTEDGTSFLFTGADMDNLSIQQENFKQMSIYALITAGVRGNAVRMGSDSGDYYEPGTINMIMLTNMKLSPRAMTRAIISATEGKTAALEDLDIRSTYQPLKAAATGTGTDNIIVVAGDGPSVDNAGGHTKMGELIARAAYAGVREAILKQNGITGPRDIFQRLAERQTSLFQLAARARCDLPEEKGDFVGRVEEMLLDPANTGFIEAAMAISDGIERNTVTNLDLFEAWCADVAGRIAGRKVGDIHACLTDEDLPLPLAEALNAVFTGLSMRTHSTEKKIVRND